MKRVLVTIMALLYLCFTSGATLHLHYCMGQFVNVSLADTRERSCGGCGMEKHAGNKGCCSHLAVTAKITDSHHRSSFHFNVPADYSMVSAPFPTFEERRLRESKILYHFDAHAPSGGSPPSLYLLHRNFRI